MVFILKLQLRDTRKEFQSEEARDRAYDKVLSTLTNLGIPENNIVLSKIDTEYSGFLSKDLEKEVGRNETNQ
jgi:hypothetical protein|tara:strand:+ start:1302 stop:1517 length:216 start_codon:yes stop_codon:yes gene_type:complete